MGKGKLLIIVGVSLNFAGCIVLLATNFNLANSIVSAVAVIALVLIGAGSLLNKKEKVL